MAQTVVGFIDMDCFYVAVERRLDPSLYGKPCAVVQYNSRTPGGAPELKANANRRTRAGAGGIIAVSYEARKHGVSRGMNGPEAMKQCPEIVIVQVPTAFGKADLSIYKGAGDEVVALLGRRADNCEKRSVDEVAIDISGEAARLLRERSWEEDLLPAARRCSHLADSAFSRSAAGVSRRDVRSGHVGQGAAEGESAEVDGWDLASTWGPKERLLVAGAVVVDELRTEVTKTLGFTCSGGVAENKMLAKLGCGLHKPDQQTILLPEAVPHLLHDMPFDKIPGLGGEFGAQIKESLQITTAGELAAVPMGRLETFFPKQAMFLHQISQGKHNDPVQDRELTKSLSSGKTFFGRNTLNTVRDCEHWLGEMARELHKRYTDDLARHARMPGKVTVSVGCGGNGGGMQGTAGNATRQMALELGRNGTVEQIANGGAACLARWVAGLPPGSQGRLGVNSLGMSLSGFKPIASGAPLSQFFGGAAAGCQATQPASASRASRSRSREPECARPAHCGGEVQGLAKAAQPTSVSRATRSRSRERGPEPARPPHGGGAVPGVGQAVERASKPPGGAIARFFSAASAAVPAPKQPPACVQVDLVDSDDDTAAQATNMAGATPAQAAPNEFDDDGIDPAVLAELPPSVRAEVLQQLRPDRRRQIEQRIASLVAAPMAVIA